MWRGAFKHDLLLSPISWRVIVGGLDGLLVKPVQYETTAPLNSSILDRNESVRYSVGSKVSYTGPNEGTGHDIFGTERGLERSTCLMDRVCHGGEKKEREGKGIRVECSLHRPVPCDLTAASPLSLLSVLT